MKITLLLFALVLAANAQTAGEKPAESRVFTLDMGHGDPGLHADVQRFVELSGARQKFAEQKKSMVEAGRKKMMERCPKCAPEFANEWARRMMQRLTADDFINVYVSAYEKYFSREDIAELIAMQEKINAHEPATTSPRLQEKVRSVMPSLMGDITGGCVKVGAEIGGKVGGEIQQEHPEYLKGAQVVR